MKQKKYKAVMLDLDGTTIPNSLDGMPSKRVMNAIKAANKSTHVGVVTARSIYGAKPIIKKLSLSSPCIVSGGAQILDPVPYRITWEVAIPKNEALEIVDKLKALNAPFVFPNPANNITPSFKIALSKEGLVTLAVPEITHQKAETIMRELDSFKNISVHKVTGLEKGTVWVTINHIEATKQYGILKVAEMLNIETHEIIGIGDSYNDFPLLMACGLKVAMGNAVPELKEIADYIAPSVDEDGVAHVIEKFIL